MREAKTKVINRIGWLEFIIALYPILAGYGYGSFKFSFGILLVLDFLIIIKGNFKWLKCLPLSIFCVYLILHDFLFLPFLSDIPSYYLNSLIATVIYSISLFIISPQIDYDRFKSALNAIAIMCMIGLLYHVVLLSSGQSVSPIKLPFLPDMTDNSRLFAINERPTSFFWEPQSYASFMLAPLFFALYHRKLLYAILIASLMIVSTSTTGLILSIFMFVSMTISIRSKWYMRLAFLLATFSLGFFLVYSSYSFVGYDKLLNTEIEESNRIVNGYLITKDLNLSDFLTGIPFASIQDAYNAGYFSSPLIVHSDGVLFVSAIWFSLIKYGVLGLTFFLLPYIWLYKKDKRLFPYLACVFLAHFSNPDFMGAAYVFQIIVMLSFINRNNNL